MAPYACRLHRSLAAASLRTPNPAGDMGAAGLQIGLEKGCGTFAALDGYWMQDQPRGMAI